MKNFNEVLAKLGEQDQDVKEFRLIESTGLRNHLYNYQKAILIIKAHNDGWEADWSDSNQRKYYIWWRMDENSLSYGGFNIWYSSSISPARLCLRSSELCKQIATNPEFIPIFKSFMIG